MIIREKEAVLYRMAIGLAHPDDLCRRIPDKLLQRAGQVRLVEIAGFEGSLEYRDALLQERFRPLCAFELADVVLGQACSSQEAVPHRTRGYLLQPIL